MITVAVAVAIGLISTLILFGMDCLFTLAVKRFGEKGGMFLGLFVVLTIVNLLLAVVYDIGKKTAPSIRSQPAQSKGVNDAAR